MTHKHETTDITDANASVENVTDEQLDDVAVGGLLLPAVTSGGYGGFATPKRKPKVWPWHYW